MFYLFSNYEFNSYFIMNMKYNQSFQFLIIENASIWQSKWQDIVQHKQL